MHVCVCVCVCVCDVWGERVCERERERIGVHVWGEGKSVCIT